MGPLKEMTTQISDHKKLKCTYWNYIKAHPGILFIYVWYVFLELLQCSPFTPHPLFYLALPISNGIHS